MAAEEAARKAVEDAEAAARKAAEEAEAARLAAEEAARPRTKEGAPLPGFKAVFAAYGAAAVKPKEAAPAPAAAGASPKKAVVVGGGGKKCNVCAKTIYAADVGQVRGGGEGKGRRSARPGERRAVRHPH